LNANYFQPGWEEFSRTLVGKIPTLIGGGPVPKQIDLSLIRARLAAMTPDTWRDIRDQLVELLSVVSAG